MSLYGSLFSGVSGLQAQSSAMGAISDNVTNVNTTGYKGTNVHFNTLVTAQVSETQYAPGGVQSSPRKGVDEQGLLQSTTSSTDMAISGQGMFIANEAAEPSTGDRYTYTRAGSFRVDKDGFLKNSGDFYLQGHPLQNWDGTATASTVEVGDNKFMKAYTKGNGDTAYINDNAVDGENLRPLNLEEIGGTAEATPTLSMGANLPAGDEIGDTHKINTQVFDSLGNSHNMNYTFFKSGSNAWKADIVPPENASKLEMQNQDGNTFVSNGRLDFRSIPQNGSKLEFNVGGQTYSINYNNVGNEDRMVRSTSPDNTEKINNTQVAFDGAVSDGDYVDISYGGETYRFEFDDDNAASKGGDVLVDVSGADSNDERAELLAQNVQTTFADDLGSGNWAKAEGNEVELGSGLQVTDEADSDNNMTRYALQFDEIPQEGDTITMNNPNTGNPYTFEFSADGDTTNNTTGPNRSVVDVSGAADVGDVAQTVANEVTSVFGTRTVWNTNGAVRLHQGGEAIIGRTVDNVNHVEATVGHEARITTNASGNLALANESKTIDLSSGNPDTGDEITIGGTTFTFDASGGEADGNGDTTVNASGTLDNTVNDLTDAINSQFGGLQNNLASADTGADTVSLDPTADFATQANVTVNPGDPDIQFSGGAGAINNGDSITIGGATFTFQNNISDTQAAQDLADAITNNANNANVNITSGDASNINATQNGTDVDIEPYSSDISLSNQDRDITLNGVPADGDTVTVDGVTFEFDRDGAGELRDSTNTRVDISGSGTAGDAGDQLASALNGQFATFNNNKPAQSDGAGTVQLNPGGSFHDTGVVDLNTADGHDISFNAIPEDQDQITVGGTTYEFDRAGDGLNGSNTDVAVDIQNASNTADVGQALADSINNNGGNASHDGDGNVELHPTIDAPEPTAEDDGTNNDYLLNTGGDLAQDIDTSGRSLSQVIDATAEAVNNVVTHANENAGIGFPPAGTNGWGERISGTNGIAFRNGSTNNDIGVDATNLLDENNDVAVQQADPFTLGDLNGTNWLNTATIEFKGDGTPDKFFGQDETEASDPRGSLALSWANGAEDMNGSESPKISQFFGNYNKADGFTQLAGEHQINYVSQNGANFGNFEGVSINEQGIVTALFDNGVTRPVFQIPLATFGNPNGLDALSGNAFIETTNSGQPTVREATSGGAGSIQASSLEKSTVDIGEEFTDMITVQRAYSAASKTITTSDDMLETLMRIKQ